MDNPRIKTVAVLCSVAFASGCGSLKPTSRTEPAVAAVSKVTHSESVADPHYQIGRSYQSRKQYDAAIAAYRKALEANPDNAEVHNALGVLYANLGKQDEAVSELNSALALAPSAAHIYNNLGYAYLLRGRYIDAVAALRVATDLDPANRRSWENMRAAEAALAKNTQPVGAAAAIEPTIKSSALEKSFDLPLAQVVGVAPNVFELRQATAQLRTNVPLTPRRQSVLKVEVANGSGVAGLASRTAASLRQRGYTVARLTNQIPYAQVTTEIQYRRGEEHSATQLNEMLSQPAKLVESSRLSSDVRMRLVLGRDIGQEMLFTDTLGADTVLSAYGTRSSPASETP